MEPKILVLQNILTRLFGSIGMKRAVYGRPFYLEAPGQRTHGQVWEKNTTFKHQIV